LLAELVEMAAYLLAAVAAVETLPVPVGA